MAISYDNRKKSYDSMDLSQKQQYNDLLKNKGDDYIGNQYMKQYNNETNNTPQSNNNSSNPINNNDTNWQNQTNFDTPTTEKTETQNNNQANKVEVSPDLDQTKFWEAPWQITVKEWTAQQTWQPDYQADSEARNREITDNLNYYWQNNRDYFSDRNTFNDIFHYNERNDSQKKILDSYWKRKEDMDYSSHFSSWESIYNWMNNWLITADQLNYIKDNNEEAYKQWQILQEEQVKLRIVNDITPPELTDISNQLQDMMKNLRLESQEALDIEEAYYGTLDRLWAYKDLENANNTVKQIEEVNNKKTAIMNRYANSTWWTVSDALAAARMAKALAPYNEQMQGLQYQYQDYANLYNQKLASANQAASVRQAQAQENQRVWNQRYTALWFAMNALTTRTPEQQAQLDIYKQQAINESNLLYQSKLNDLNRYNAYATAKLQNQLQNELTDLSVTDANQLKANLNNILKSYYDSRWAIIQRPQAEVVEDVIAYAQKNWVSVAEALRKNFIEPLQSKKEYKTKVASDFWMDKYQQQYSYSIDENWNIKISASWYGEIPEEAFKTRATRQEAYWDVYENSINWESYVQNLAWSIKDGSYGWQCWAFCNDVLIWWWESKVFWNTLQEKTKACNVDKEEWPQVWYAAVFDLWFTSKDGENHGHVWFVSNVNGDGSIDVIESNWKSDETIHVKTYSKAAVDQMVVWYYKPSSYDLQKEVVANYSTASETKPYEWTSKVTSTWAKVNAWWWITDLENEYIKEKWDNKDIMNKTLDDYWISIQEYNAQKKKYLDYTAKVSLIDDTKKMYNAVKDLLDWNKKYSSSWAWSRHSGQVDLATYESIANGTPVDTFRWGQSKFDKQTANWVNKYNYLKNSQLLEKYQELKKAWATFWAMQKSEWDLVWSAASNLNWLSTDAEFEQNLLDMLNHYSNILADAGVEWFYSTDI